MRQITYFLDIVPAQTSKELVANAFDAASGWKQLSFDYA